METEKGWGWAGQCGPHLTYLGGGEVVGSNLPVTGFREAGWRWLTDKPRFASRLSALTVTEPHKLWAQQHL